MYSYSETISHFPAPGVVMSTIVAANSSVQSYLVVLDAKTFQEVARANLPSEKKVSLTFHGIFTDKKF